MNYDMMSAEELERIATECQNAAEKKKLMVESLQKVVELMKESGISIYDVAMEVGIAVRPPIVVDVSKQLTGPEGQFWSGRGRKPQWALKMQAASEA